MATPMEIWASENGNVDNGNAANRNDKNGNAESRNAESPQPFAIFEKYLKMTRFESSKEELLAKCTVPLEDCGLQTIPITLALPDDGSFSAADLLEFDQVFLQTLREDGDFSDTLSDFSSMSMSQGSRRKKKRCESWNRYSSNSDGRKAPSPRHINHKIVVMQHESSQTFASGPGKFRIDKDERSLGRNMRAVCHMRHRKHRT